jgi:hypothetical protein
MGILLVIILLTSIIQSLNQLENMADDQLFKLSIRMHLKWIGKVLYQAKARREYSQDSKNHLTQEEGFIHFHQLFASFYMILINEQLQ